MPIRLALCTALALLAFAGNSLLCRLALAAGRIDAASFTILRLTSGALTLVLLLALRGSVRARLRAGSFTSAAALFLYAAPFSFAYLSLGAGPGALLLFGAVQLTMLTAGVRRGERPSRLQWGGIALALAGLAGLTLPGAHAPEPWAAAAMSVAGIAWGVYSLRGRGAHDPRAATAGNFLRSLVFVPLLALAFVGREPRLSAPGIGLAVISGALTSGLGYALWYAALPGLSVTLAAILQLLVPVLAALGGIVLLGETATTRLLVAGPLLLGGVALALPRRLRRAPPSDGISARP